MSYARSGELRIAYTVEGTGAVDLVFVSGWVTAPESLGRDLRPAHFLSQLAAFSRLIRFDRRGTGLSDRAVGTPSLEHRLEDLLAVLDAAGSARAALLAYGDGVTTALLFAALHAERVAALVLLGASAKPVWAPTVARALGRSSALVDTAELLPAIAVPALLLHRSADREVGIEQGRAVAAKLPQARLVELSGAETVPWLESERLLVEIEEFVTGVSAAALEARVIATVLFTDLVASTELIRRVGDRAWSELLAEHNLAVRREFARYGAEEINSTGDGFFAVFEAPSRAIRCAVEIRRALRERELEMRAGIHTGEVERAGREVLGIAVHLAARIMGAAGAGEILVSSTTRDLISGSNIELIDLGERSFKGIAEPKRIFSLASG